MTYGEVEMQSNKIAHFLITLGVGPNVNVGIIAEKSFEMIIGILGVLKAGGAYTPIDPDCPICRITHIVKDAQLKVILSHIPQDLQVQC